MRLSRIILIVVVVVIIVIIAVSAYALLTPAPKSPWTNAATYPIEAADTLGVSGQQCVNGMQYILCVGGQDVLGGPHNAVYASSQILSGALNITSWTPDSHYPITVYAQSCATGGGYVYCVGGTFDDGGDDVNSTYFASLGSTGVVGIWQQTTDYPIAVDSQSCVVSSGYIYCVGGAEEPDGTNATRGVTNVAYYAPISSAGVGEWTQTAAYPSSTYLPSCTEASGTIYCLGGVNSGSNPVDAVYYASLSSAGVGTWTATTPYPADDIGQSCAVSAGYIICVGGEGSSQFLNNVYLATVSSTGVGSWSKTVSYTDSTWTTCLVSSGTLYCMGGLDSSSARETATVSYIPVSTLVTSGSTTG